MSSERTIGPFFRDVHSAPPCKCQLCGLSRAFRSAMAVGDWTLADEVYNGLFEHGAAAEMQYAADRDRLGNALQELHRAVTEHDGSDADDARLADAVKAAQAIAPYEPALESVDGF